MIGRQVICSKCRRAGICRAVLEVQHAPRRVFCDVACMALFVREEYIEASSSTGRVLATPVEAARPPWVRVSTGIGGAREPVGSGKSPVAPGPSTPERFFGAFRRVVRA